MAESLYIFTFGKFNGYPIEDVPINYLEYLLEQDDFCKNKSLVEIFNKEIKYRKDNSTEKEIDKKWNRR